METFCPVAKNNSESFLCGCCNLTVAFASVKHKQRFPSWRFIWRGLHADATGFSHRFLISSLPIAQVFVCPRASSRQRYAKLSAALITQGFHQAASDPSLFTRVLALPFLALLVYVDDVILARTELMTLQSLKLIFIMPSRLWIWGIPLLWSWSNQDYFWHPSLST